MRLRLLALAVLPLMFLLPGCGDDDEDEAAEQPAQTEQAAGAPKGTFVGTVTGTDSYIAIVSDGKRLTGYVCDSKEVSTWVQAKRVEGDVADLESRDGERIGRVSFAGETASGNVEVAGKERTFTLSAAKGEAGLYRAAEVKKKDGKLGEDEVEVGWVVLADGSQRGGTNFINPNMDIVDLPKVNPGAGNLSVTTAGGNAIKLAQQRVRGVIDPIAF